MLVKSEFEKVFGMNLRGFRRANGMTLKVLAEKMTDHGVRLTEAQVSRIELGTRPTNVREIVAFAECLKVTAEMLLSTDGLSEGELSRIAAECERTRLEAAVWDATAALQAAEAALAEFDKAHPS